MDGNELAEFIKNVPVIKEAYEDIAQPAAREAGKTLGLIPRAINAALAPLEIWIMKQEFNIERTKQLLEAELAHVDPKKIVPPEPYVAVPALQAIAYSMDSDNLRSMYAKLLAKAMLEDERDSVHPGFVEVIKQMSPLDAENLSIICQKRTVPIAEYRLMQVCGSYIPAQKDVFLDNPRVQDIQKQAASLGSLQRLGLVTLDYSQHLAKDKGVSNIYERFKNTPDYRWLLGNISPVPADGYQRPRDDNLISEVAVYPGVCTITPFGEAFAIVCIIPSVIAR